MSTWPLAERHIAEAARHVEAQRKRVAELERDGHDTTEARRLILNFEGMQVMHIEDRDRIAKELAELGG